MADRVTQVTGEVVEKPSPNASVTQVTGEAVAKPAPNARVTQVFAEVVYPKTDLPTRAIVTQVAGEAVAKPAPNARVTQVTGEAVAAPDPNAVVTQVFAEAIFPNTATPSFTLDATFRRTISGSFTFDAVIEPEPSGDCDFESAFQEDAFQEDAFQICVVSLGFQLDAVVFKTQSASFTLNAIFSAFFHTDFTFDAWILGTTTESLTLDAVITDSYEATLDAVISAVQTESFTLGAWIYRPRADPGGPGEPGETPLVSIIVDGEDITSDVVLEDCTFTMLVNGAVGSCHVRVRDDAHERTFATGAEITVDIDGRRKFGGYVMQPKRMLGFPVEDTTDPSKPSRFHVLDGVDYNILLQKRVLFNADNPADVGLRNWPAGSRDDVVIRYIFDHYTTLPEDGVTYNGVQHIGFPNPDKTGVVGSGGLLFADALREVNRLISGVFYIDPFKDLNYVDVDEPDAEFGLSDNPGPGEVGFREFEYVRNGSQLRNDALLWGAGIGSRQMVFSRVTDQPSIDEHGLWQYGEFTTALYKQASVDLRTDTIVNGTPQSQRGGKNDAESWSVTSFEPSFTAGQKVAIESEVFGISDVVPIRRMTLTFPTKRSVRQQLVLSHEIDEPWNLFEFPPFPGFGPFPTFPPIDIPDGPDPPRICDPADFVVGSLTGGTMSCVIPEVPGAQPLGCNTSANPTGSVTNYVFLYSGATYRVDYAFDYTNNIALHAYLAHASGSPISHHAGGNVEHGTDQPFEHIEDVVVGPTGDYELHLDGLNHSNYAIFGGGVSAGVVWVSGPDPRFEGIDCIDGDPGQVDQGSSQEGQTGDGTTTVFNVGAAYVPGSTRVFVGGWFMRPTFEYLESDPASGEITFFTPPADGLSITILYEAFGAPF